MKDARAFIQFENRPGSCRKGFWQNMWEGCDRKCLLH